MVGYNQSVQQAKSFKAYIAENIRLYEMTGRRSFMHTMGKFEPPTVGKPVAVLTAWRGTLLDQQGQPYPEPERRRLNDEANQKLIANIQQRGLSHYPVVGAGQEMEQGVLTVNKENSLVVQPRDDMPEDEFLNHVRELLYNPTSEQGNGPFPHTQDGALVKLPSAADAYFLCHSGNCTGPQDYTDLIPLGKSAEPRLPQDPYYTQMKYGPRADQGMMDAADKPDDVGNPKPGTGKPGAGLPGKRFTIKDKNKP